MQDQTKTEYIWEEIPKFRSPKHFKKFVDWLEQQLKEAQCVELPSGSKSIGPLRKFRQSDCLAVWMLKYPDPGYFPGSWSKVK